ncbi:MAG TPA: Sua5/YciO/YrdC/YwlC family protein [Gemmataceae bacterium]|jgi:protein-tyrosine phosphatase
MPEVLDWQRVADPHAVIQYAVQSLCQGRTVAFPGETGYALAASGLAPEAVRQLPGAAEGEALTLAVRGPAEACDWAPAMSPLARRLARRLWPGPVTLLVGGAIEQGLASRLAEEVRARLCLNDTLRLAQPGHELLREVLRHLPGPLVFVPLSGEGTAALERMDVIVEDGPNPDAQQATLIAVNGDTWQVVQPGALSAEDIRQRTACQVVFVCTGNTCRSPLAEALCKKRLADHLGCTVEELPARGFQVLSAGVAATVGAPAAAEAETVARSYGADLSAHRSQPLTLELAARTDYLVGMTQGHLHALTDYFGHLGATTRLLDPDGDIADPIGREQSIYDECGQQIWRHLESFVAEIVPAEASQP